MNMVRPGAAERLAALGAAFCERLQTDARRLRELAPKLDARESDARASALEEIRCIAHKLHGTAPAFDAEDVGTAARQLEDAALAMADRAQESQSLLRERLGALLALLDAATSGDSSRVFRPRL